MDNKVDITKQENVQKLTSKDIEKQKEDELVDRIMEQILKIK
jgi:hypothetical protein